ncbi:flavin reductase family protein [Neobacillus niacini]|uniref:flavin reductase family protein n=1 Tax=Neobacillus niacini TaxID=86668 RepID=UPI00286426C0|nr:flavin reductase family protein [Neobacillus niacini]MDR7002650.1 flavin reductase (DIM6/NTAB) family NADH-FMN oxidoreductase RutF [Neobacillus niacini]
MKNFIESTVISPRILYYGTPVILLTTLNQDGTTNISPISSSWALGDFIILGISTSGKAFENLQTHPECVINLPDPSLWRNVENLAPFTGKNPVPDFKKELGFSYKKEKYPASGLTELDSKIAAPSRIMECPIQIEARVLNIRILDYSPMFAIIESKALVVHAHTEILKDTNHIDPAKWSPLIYNFRHYFGLGEELGKTFRSET